MSTVFRDALPVDACFVAYGRLNASVGLDLIQAAAGAPFRITLLPTLRIISIM